jgi:hypothetical protein
MRSFFETFAGAVNKGDNETLTSLYADTFMFGGVQGAQAVKAEDFKLVLPKRQGFFASIGLRLTELVALDETVLSEKYTLAKVTWRMTYEKKEQEKIQDTTYATYVLCHDGEGYKIILQLDHQDLTERVKSLGLV